MVSPDPIRARPGTDPVATLIFYTGPGDVETVLVDGEIRKRANEIVGIDMGDLARRCAHSLTTIRTRYASLPGNVVEGAWRGMF